jgi:hypothetical protein
VAGSGKKQLTCPSPAWGSDKPATSLVLKLYKGDLQVDSRQSADQVCVIVGDLMVTVWCERVGGRVGERVVGWVGRRGMAWHGVAWCLCAVQCHGCGWAARKLCPALAPTRERVVLLTRLCRELV